MRLTFTMVLGGVLLLAAGCGVSPATGGPGSSTPTPPPATSNAPTPVSNPLILAPATTPSSVGVCTEQMAFGADGTAGPLLCSDGAVNTLAWTYFDQMYPDIFALGAYATEGQVAQAASQLVPNGTLPTAEDAYCLAKAYYGWQFGVSLDPANELGTGASCAGDIPNFP